ncbi:MAG TPA: peptidase C25, partial [Thermoplasmatales archaeon]|nr:peptidase C25 [Thermoplasmatales archaeon]
DFDISIDYDLPSSLPFVNDEYDLLIIAPDKWIDALQQLKQHKESHGIRTVIKTVEDIINEYSGRDSAEKVKYAIKDAIEQWGIKYVMLVGGLSSPIKSDEWLLPVRYSNLNDMSETSYLTDLYFADVYKYEDGEPVFDDWDSNGNGIFAEWGFRGKDILDLYPDVYVGRLACRSDKELETVINKIISYENTADDSWFKRAVLVGGDTFNDINGNNYLEGEIANQRVAEILDDFENEKIWWSENEVNQKNVVNAIGKGCGFVHLSGHGSPAVWFVKDFIKNPNGKYIWALDVYHFPLLKNENKLPIVIIGGCHNSMFNTSLYKSTKEVITTIIIKYILGQPYTTWYWIPAPESMGWWFVKQEGGGAIATFGCTGLGLGTIGDNNKDGIPDCIQYLLTWLELRFFEVYKNGVDILGETWGNAINDYINEFLMESKDSGDIKTIQEWVLLGDPSLKIGGYQ